MWPLSGRSRTEALLKAGTCLPALSADHSVHNTMLLWQFHKNSSSKMSMLCIPARLSSYIHVSKPTAVVLQLLSWNSALIRAVGHASAGARTSAQSEHCWSCCDSITCRAEMPSREVLQTALQWDPIPLPVPNFGYACLNLELRYQKPPIFTNR